MVAQERKATTVWEGDFKSGKGQVSLDTSHVGTFDVSTPSRFESSNGLTSPEELIAAAHSSCFSMALSNILASGGNPPERLDTSAVVTIERVGEGWTITKSAITLRARVPGISEEDFRQAADKAKAGCPVSRALSGNVDISLDAQLA
jgi:osmotically inducible protein OsmC